MLAETDLFSRIFPWIAALLGLTIAGAIVIALVRRTLRDRDGDATGGFTLHDLRRMHAAGDLTDEEFASARASLIEKFRGAGGDADRGQATSAPADSADGREDAPGSG